MLLDQETWLPVVGYEGRYEVSDRGRVRSLITTHGTRRREPHLLRPAPVGDGYRQVVLSLDGGTRHHLVHRLVLEAFVGPCPEGMESAHRDGDGSCNYVGNLRWATHQDNCADKVAHGTNQGRSGETNPQSKLTAAQVGEIRGATGTQVSIARRFGLDPSWVSRIRSGKAWKEVAHVA